MVIIFHRKITPLAPVVGQKVKEIEKFISPINSMIPLKDLISINRFWQEDDGDNSISVTSDLTLDV
ncbi:hypothetical protein A9G28_10450 [Gilliamella sp. Fer1-1]|nr:hypothetical protein A9G47_01605 [Gilliamella apicola]OCG25814.1 hypothetical protein A9G46_06845 [Gilliamella apicola]OCG28935.1 hypothetical protein A9G45_05935 [Gilliamella apicola]OCG39016.1 hypothetical protein A9G28_10450 [Gilliamella apicola]OCG74128.1 hypothetical protein A9G42_10650 [Gilliamella apicola]